MITKTKRIKKVFTSSQETYHKWASQTQSYGRQSGKMRRAFFEGDSCYSYGYHYKVAQLVKINGVDVALINRSGYSHTTAKHINEAASAVSHMPRINVDGSFDWKNGLLEMQQDLIDSLFKPFNSRKFYSGYCVWDEYDRSRFTEFNKTCDTVKMPQLKIWPDNDLIDVLEQHVKACQKHTKQLEELRLTPEYIAKRDAKIAKEQEREQAKAAMEIEAWKNGGPFTNAVTMLKPQIVRINAGMVQTSNKAQVNIYEARSAIQKILSGTIMPGDYIGDYVFNGHDRLTNLVHIGCHTINLGDAAMVLAEKRLKIVG